MSQQLFALDMIGVQLVLNASAPSRKGDLAEGRKRSKQSVFPSSLPSSTEQANHFLSLLRRERTDVQYSTVQFRCTQELRIHDRSGIVALYLYTLGHELLVA